MKEKKCEGCEYYCRHYIKNNDSYHAIGCGHCVYPRLKARYPENPACRYFAAAKKHRDGKKKTS